MRASGADLVFVDAGRVDYLRAWERQRALAQARLDGTGPDTVLLLEHDDVYTAGRRTQPEDRPTDGTEVVEVDRGGRITWHGPGQLVGYPIVA
ncbi:MAG: lipoyl protein ligase domain-containing protein, partial [Nakamurella sp.]